MERIALFGGSFDPVHVGHLHAARVAEEAFALARVIFVPAARPPHKPGRSLADGGHRVAMLRLAIAGEPSWSVWTGELEREGPSYTFDTVLALEREGVHATHFVVGDDNLAGLADWRRAPELLARLQPIVVPREGGDRELLERVAARFPAALAERLRAGWVEREPVPVSATELRERLERGEDPGDRVPPAVREYLLSHAIYRR